ncbi:MAG: alpha-glucosidase [Lachnospiraceae bacterium]|nr:alpha-glucosidase [Lachnospiraceae bacterium]
MKNRKTAALLLLILTVSLTLVSCGYVKYPAAVSKSPGSAEASPVVREDLKWWQETIAYEIYVKSFKDSDGDGIGDLKGIISELDHLKDLGVGAVWLTPCYVSPQADNGYDIADYYDIDPAYGTMEDMDELIAEADKRGIRIVMDLVFNHTSNQNAWFTESASGKGNDKSDWYIWRDPKEDGSAPTNWRSIFGGSAWEYNEERGQYYLHTFLPEQPDLNWANPEVRRAVIDVADFWVKKGVGGFRMDAITYIKKPAEFLDGEPDAGDGMVGIHSMTANTDGILDYLNEFKKAVQTGTDIFTVGEANGVSAEDLPDWVGADGVFDMVFEFGFVDIDLPDESNWCETREWTLPEFKQIFTASEEMTSGTIAGGWYPMFLENHDQPRSISHFLSAGADRTAGGKALGTLLLTMRGTPFIMEGQELGYINVDWPSIDDYDDISTKNHYQFALDEGYSEEEAMAGVHRFARDSARTPMQWDSSENAGFTAGKPWLPVYDDYAVCNVEEETADPGSVLNWYFSLVKLRNGHRELVDGSYEELFPEDEQIFAYVRENDEARAVVLINLSTESAAYDASCVAQGELLLGTEGESEKGLLKPLEAVIFEKRK